MFKQYFYSKMYDRINYALDAVDRIYTDLNFYEIRDDEFVELIEEANEALANLKDYVEEILKEDVK